MIGNNQQTSLNGITVQSNVESSAQLMRNQIHGYVTGEY